MLFTYYDFSADIVLRKAIVLNNIIGFITRYIKT